MSNMDGVVFLIVEVQPRPLDSTQACRRNTPGVFVHVVVFLGRLDVVKWELQNNRKKIKKKINKELATKLLI